MCQAQGKKVHEVSSYADLERLSKLPVNPAPPTQERQSSEAPIPQSENQVAAAITPEETTALSPIAPGPGPEVQVV